MAVACSFVFVVVGRVDCVFCLFVLGLLLVVVVLLGGCGFIS